MAVRVVVEWTRLTLRLALAEGSESKLRLRSVYCQPIAAPEEAMPTLKALLKTAKITTADVIGVVSREQVITRVVKFPTLDPAELAKMVELYAKAQLPYAREQTIMDFHVLSRKEGSSTVAIVACQREVIDRTVGVLKGAGLTVRMLTLSPWGVLGWYRQAIKPQSVQEPCLVINVDDGRTDLVLIGSGRILSTRSIGQGAQDWAAGSETTELLFQEVERSRASIRKESPDFEVRSVALTGLAGSSAWSEPLAQRLRLAVIPVESRQGFKGALIPTAPAISPVVAAGIGVSDLRGLLNVSPEDMRTQVRHRQQVSELVVVGLLLLGVLAIGAGLLGFRATRQHQFALQLEQVLGEVQPTAKDIQEKKRAGQFVASILDERKALGQVLVAVFQATPPPVTLEGLAFERARSEVVVRGTAPSTQEVLNYVGQLEHLNGVSNVQLRYSTSRITPAGERTDFELVLQQDKKPAKASES